MDLINTKYAHYLRRGKMDIFEFTGKVLFEDTPKLLFDKIPRVLFDELPEKGESVLDNVSNTIDKFLD